jgi:UDP-2,3-diacylglucosamine pyrophosphatase LpxH
MPHVRSIFLSDVHLGIRVSQADRLLEFLRVYSAENLFLVGDIIDFEAMRRAVYWTPAHNTVVQKILRRARHGERVVFVPGNHDAAARAHAGSSFGAIRVELEWIHVAADGRRYLIVHGDACDPASGYHGLLAWAGDVGYTAALHANRWLLALRRKLRLRGHWSLPGYAKRRIVRAQRYVREFEEAVAQLARERRLEGVICGHIHVAAARHIDGVDYLNCGDWVESLTAVVEHHDGRLELVHWSDAGIFAALSPARSQKTALAG